MRSFYSQTRFLQSIFFAGLVFVTFFAFAPISHAATFVSGTISTDTAWTIINSPYVVQGSLTVAQGVTLTIEPGVIVKFDTPSFFHIFNVNGNLAVQGTAENKAYFTSLKDDSVGGDTNGDGSASVPANQDWTGIFFNPGSAANLANAVIRYAGRGTSLNSCGCAIVNSGGTINISNSEIAYTDANGIRQFGSAGSITITNSEFHHHDSALWLEDGTVNVSSTNFRDNRRGINATDGSLALANSSFINHTSASAEISAKVFFVHSNNIASGGPRNGFVLSGTLDMNQTWQADMMPYIVAPPISSLPLLTIASGAILTIEPRVIIKLDTPAFFHTLNVNGVLNVMGTPENKAHFTSLKDDSVGGDTNGDGAITSPAAQDWTGIFFNPGSTGSFANAVIRYAGKGAGLNGCDCALVNSGGALTLSNSSITDTSRNGIRQLSGSLVVTASELNNHYTAIWIEGGVANVSQSSIHDNSGFGIFNAAADIVGAENNWWGHPSGPFHPVLNPSGQGNRVSDNIDFIPWLTSDPLQAPPQRDPIIIIPGILGSEEKNGRLILQPRLRVYDGLKQTLLANGHVEGETEFDFPYNWRQSNVVTAQQLRDKINGIKAICACGKVDIIAHSMGGLIARQYIQSDLYQNDIDQLIFLGTPHIGAPKAYFAWEGGTAGPDIEDLFLNALIRQEAIEAGFGGISDVKRILFNYIHNPSSPILSLREILPIYSYLKDFDSNVLRSYPNDYPQNAFLENLNTPSSTAALEESGVDITNVFSGSQGNTISFLKVKNDASTLPLWERGVPKEVERGNGDITVPLASSLALNVANSINLGIGGEHKDLPTNAAGKAVEILTGQPATTVITISPIKRFLSIFGLSPIDILVTAPDGKRIGKDFATGQEINEIEGAFYTGFNTPNENIFIPDPLDGEYVITTQGTGDGSYTILTDYIREEPSGEATSTIVSFVGNTTPGREAELNLNFSAAAPQEISIIPADTIAPSTTAAVSGVPGNSGWYLSDVSVALSAQDNEGGTGVFKTEYSLDNGVSWNIYSLPLAFTQEGITILLYRSQDFVGNIEEPKTLEIKIDKTPPEAVISLDINSFDLKIEGADISATAVSAISEKIYQIQDEAGHALTLNFKKLKDKKRSLHISLESIQYDNAPKIVLPKNRLNYEWSINKKEDEIRILNQRLFIKDELKAHAIFKQKKNETEIKIMRGSEKNKQKEKQILPGLHILKLITRSGGLDFGF